MSRLHRFKALTTVFIALSCVASLSVSLGHELLVEHIRCQTHGAWVHGDDVHADDTLTDQNAAVVFGDSEGSHEHCELLAIRDDDDGIHVHRSGHVAIEVRAFDALLSRVSSHAMSSRHVFTLAPKTSPPA